MHLHVLLWPVMGGTRLAGLVRPPYAPPLPLEALPRPGSSHHPELHAPTEPHRRWCFSVHRALVSPAPQNGELRQRGGDSPGQNQDMQGPEVRELPSPPAAHRQARSLGRSLGSWGSGGGSAQHPRWKRKVLVSLGPGDPHRKLGLPSHQPASSPAAPLPGPSPSGPASPPRPLALRPSPPPALASPRFR